MRELRSAMETIETDVLVVGGGGAGFRAAIGARERGARAVLVSKGPLARSGASPMAGADLTCHGQGMHAAGFPGDPNDSAEKFFSDVVHHGCCLNDQRLTELFIEGGPQRMLEMVSWGMRADRTDQRAVYTSGTHIMDVLFKRAKRVGVGFLEDVAVLDLIRGADGPIVGALALDIRRGRLILVRCKAVVLAAGGWHKAYTPVTGSRELTGDGVAMALRAGADCADMEFVTFACDIPYWPLDLRGSITGYYLAFLGGILVNGAGEPIYARYDPWMVARAVHTEWNKCFYSHISALEIRAGKTTPHGGVLYQVGDEPFEVFEARAMELLPGWAYKGNDVSVIRDKLRSGEGLEVGPGAEYFEGGVAVDDRYATSVPGLFAAGECAASVFGANRVAAATMEMLTTGAIAGRSAGDHAGQTVLGPVLPDRLDALADRALRPLCRPGPAPASELRERIQNAAQQMLGAVRHGTELERFLLWLGAVARDELPQLGAASPDPVYNKGWLEALDVENMVTVLTVSARAALERTESRGVHYREDAPTTDNDHWLRQTVLRQVDGELAVRTQPVTIAGITPPAGARSYIDYLKLMMQSHSDTGGAH
jgi:succinate dehydrogenase/fumarate reductase flavoprotein subunit